MCRVMKFIKCSVRAVGHWVGRVHRVSRISRVQSR